MSGSLGTILIVLLILMLLGVIPSWPHSKSWGYGPSGGLGTVLIIVLVVVLMGRIDRSFGSAGAPLLPPCFTVMT